MLRKIMLASLILFAGLLAACGGGEPMDPEAIAVELTTKEPALAGKETILPAKLVGAQFPEETFVQFDVRLDIIPRLIDGQDEGDDVYTANFTFPEAGTYDVYMHIYIDDLHLTKLAQVVVQ